MGIVSGGGGGGNTTAQVVASGKLIPAADPAGVTVDTTTYDNPVTGSGKLTTLVFPGHTATIALAEAGDSFPRWLMTTEGHPALYIGNGNADPYAAASCYVEFATGGGTGIPNATTANSAAALGQLSPKTTITSGALSTVQLVSATGAQILTGRDAETITPCTFNPGAATTATVTVALSPDDVTYSTLAVVTEPAGVALDGTILPVKVRVPAGWYLKLTVNAQAVLGLTTYY